MSARRLFCDVDKELLCLQYIHINCSVVFVMTTTNRKVYITGTAGRFLWRSLINVPDIFTLVVSYYFSTLLKALQLMCTGLLTPQFSVLTYFLSKRRKWASLEICMLVCVCVCVCVCVRERERERQTETASTTSSSETVDFILRKSERQLWYGRRGWHYIFV